jgi:hypothetical protein
MRKKIISSIIVCAMVFTMAPRVSAEAWFFPYQIKLDVVSIDYMTTPEGLRTVAGLTLSGNLDLGNTSFGRNGFIAFEGFGLDRTITGPFPNLATAEKGSVIEILDLFSGYVIARGRIDHIVVGTSIAMNNKANIIDIYNAVFPHHGFPLIPCFPSRGASVFHSWISSGFGIIPYGTFGNKTVTFVLTDVIVSTFDLTNTGAFVNMHINTGMDVIDTDGSIFIPAFPNTRSCNCYCNVCNEYPCRCCFNCGEYPSICIEIGVDSDIGATAKITPDATITLSNGGKVVADPEKLSVKIEKKTPTDGEKSAFFAALKEYLKK